MVGSGGELKAMVAAGQVETQKRKKIMGGDIIEFAEEKIRIHLSPTSDQENHEDTGTNT